MKERLLEELIPQVRENCLISDARYWGFYSICGLLMRLRELYRFEKDLGPEDRIDRGDISDWIGQREGLWEKKQDKELRPVSVEGREFSPFDSEGINRHINALGLLYGGGLGMYLKPVFFLSELESMESLRGFSIRTAGKEYVRDLSVHPAMLQGRTIIARKNAAYVLVNEKFEEFKAMKHRNDKSALATAFRSYGVDASSPHEKLVEVSENELMVYVHHEMGEAAETDKSGELWLEMLSNTGHWKASVFLRGLKDTLADTSEKGMLRHIIDQRRAGSLAFYAASLTGFRKTLAGEVEHAFRAFTETGRWEDIESARSACYSKTKVIADELLGAYRVDKDPDALDAAVEKRISLICPRRR